MLIVRRTPRLCTRMSPFIRTLPGDHVGAPDQSAADEQVKILLDELARERNLVRDLRMETEKLKDSLATFNRLENQLKDLQEQLADQKSDTESYKQKLVESEKKLNESRIQFRDFKDGVEIEKKRLKQGQTLPIVLAGILGAAITYASVWSKMELDNQNFKFLKFELETLWMNRVKEIDDRLQREIDENDRLVNLANSLKADNSSGYLSVWGTRIL
jgi:uncharacterized phage infection (PIP) family protein YhgE